MKRNKIPYKRFCYESCAVDGNYFKEIKGITRNDIKALSPHELNRIPLSWLHDWAQAHDLLGDPLVTDWLETIEQNRRYPDIISLKKADNKIEVRSSLEYNHIIWANYTRTNGAVYLYNVHDFGGQKSFSLTQELIKRINEWVQNLFITVERLGRNDSDFLHVRFDGNDVYFKRLRGCRYQFVCNDNDGNVRQDVCEVGEYLRRSEMFNKETRQAWGVNTDIMLRVKTGDFPFLDVPDEYFVREIKYVCECASPEEAAYLSDIDGKTRFVPTKEVYGVEDITVQSYELRSRYGIVIPASLKMQITIDGKPCSADWNANRQDLYIDSHGFGRDIKITDGLQKRFTNLLNSIETKSIKRGAI